MVRFQLVTFLRSVAVFSILTFLKYLSRIFYKQDFAFLGDPPRDPWANVRLVVFLNHTSLFEPVFLGAVPGRFIWRLAAHGVIPAADKTTGRPLVDLLAENKEIAKHLDRAALEKLCDPANYLGQAGEMVDRVLAGRQKR